MERLFQSINQSPLLYGGAILLVVVLLVIARTIIVSTTTATPLAELESGDCVKVEDDAKGEVLIDGTGGYEIQSPVLQSAFPSPLHKEFPLLVQRVECGEDSESEVMQVHGRAVVSGDEYPSQGEFQAAIEDHCPLSSYFMLRPNRASWMEGERNVLCAEYD